MIYLLTGTPGSGKTLSALEFIETVQRETPGRIIYSANIEGMCMPGVLPIDDDGIRSWHESCEPNSLIVVDEAQRYWRAQRSGEPSPAVIEMETHRHDGIDIVLMTQHPTFLHSNIRKLVNVHTHLAAYTKNSALRWEWRECHDDVQDNSLRTQGEFKEWTYPERLYQFYKSATQHTKRAKRPLKQVLARLAGWFALAILVAVFVTIGVMAYRYKHPSKDSAATAHATDAGDAPVRAGQGTRATPISAREYIAQQLPRVASQPWSAPIYDGQAVTQHPHVWCIAPADPRNDDCRCITEQGTRYAMDAGLCRKLAIEGGTYDPYKPERRDDAPAPPTDRTMQPVVASATLPAGIPGPVPAGVGAQAYTPPAYGKWNADAFGKQQGGQ